jgi:hypothetical protein
VPAAFFFTVLFFFGFAVLARALPDRRAEVLRAAMGLSG